MSFSKKILHYIHGFIWTFLSIHAPLSTCWTPERKTGQNLPVVRSSIYWESMILVSNVHTSRQGLKKTNLSIPSRSLTLPLKSYLPNRKVVFQPPFCGGGGPLPGFQFSHQDDMTTFFRTEDPSQNFFVCNWNPGPHHNHLWDAVCHQNEMANSLIMLLVDFF